MGKAEPWKRWTLGLSESPSDAGHQEKGQGKKARKDTFLSGTAGQNLEGVINTRKEQELKHKSRRTWMVQHSTHSSTEKYEFLQENLDGESEHQGVVLLI